MDKALAVIPLGETRITFHEQGASIPDDVTFEEMEWGVKLALRYRKGLSFSLVDMIQRARELWGEAYAQLVDITQMSNGTLYNLTLVYNHFPTPEHRIWDLSISHYQVVSVSDLTWDQKAELLTLAVENEWTREELRDAKASMYGPPVQPKKEFSKEAFITRVRHLLEWAEAREAPKELLDAVNELLVEFMNE